MIPAIPAIMMLGGAGLMAYRFLTGEGEKAPTPTPLVQPPQPYVAPAPLPAQPQAAPSAPTQGWVAPAVATPKDFPEVPFGPLPMARVTTKETPLAIRPSPSTNGTPLGSAPKDALVNVVEWNYAPDWAAIEYGGVRGYSNRQYLSNYPTG